MVVALITFNTHRDIFIILASKHDHIMILQVTRISKIQDMKKQRKMKQQVIKIMNHEENIIQVNL